MAWAGMPSERRLQEVALIRRAPLAMFDRDEYALAMDVATGSSMDAIGRKWGKSGETVRRWFRELVARAQGAEQ